MTLQSMSLSPFGSGWRLSAWPWRDILLGGGPLRDKTYEDDTRVRRAFVCEMLDRNPSAFASEHDVQSMMRMFPEQF
jgi:hypothetical protein